MNILGIFKTKKNATVTDVDEQLMKVASERQAIAERKEALTQIIAAMYGTPDAEAAESEHGRLDVRLKALAIVEGNLRTERRAAEVRETLAGYQERLETAEKTRAELRAVEQGENGLLAIEKRYKELVSESKRLRYSYRGQMDNISAARHKQAGDVIAGILALDAQHPDLFNVEVRYSHTDAAFMNEVYGGNQ
jgi:hypothetical protein